MIKCQQSQAIISHFESFWSIVCCRLARLKRGLSSTSIMSPIKHIPVSAGLSLDKMVGTKFKIVGKKIGAGNFGEVRIGKNVLTEEKVAVKIERILQDQKGLCATIRLKQEYEMLKLIYKGYPSGHKINGIPKLYHFARYGRTKNFLK